MRNRKKWIKKSICLAAAGAMACGLWGCGDSQGSTEAEKLAAKQYVYRPTDLELLPDTDDGKGWSNISALGIQNEKIVALTLEEQYLESGYTQVYKLVTMNMDGSGRQEKPFFTSGGENNGNLSYLEITENGIYGTLETWNYDDQGGWDGEIGIPEGEIQDTEYEEDADDAEDEDTEDDSEDGGTDGEGEASEGSSSVQPRVSVSKNSSIDSPIARDYTETRTLELVCWNLNGEEQWRKSLIPEDMSEEEYYYVERMLILDGGRILVMSGSRMDIYGSDGTLTESIPRDQEQYFDNIFMGRDGSLMVTSWGENGMVMSTLDLKTGKTGDPVEFPFNVYNYNISGSKYYDLLLRNSTGVFGYNLGDQDPTPLMNIINSDIATTSINGIVEISETQFLGSYYDNLDGTQHAALFTYVDPADIPDKEVISIATYYMDYQMRRRVIEFNKTNETYRITVIDYSQYSAMDDYMSGYTRLNNDILAGNTPDIIVIDNNMPVDSYIAKGVLANIYDFLDEDEELNREDYFQNILDAFSVNGKLYTIVPDFYVQTVLGKTADVGTEPGWTMQDLKAVLATKPEGTNVFESNTTRDGIMWYVMMMALPQYMDRETGKCSFDSQGFMDLLEFLKEFPTEGDPNAWEDPDYWDNYQSQWREGRTLLAVTNITEARDLIQTAHGTFGEPVTFIGFPTESGNGSIIQTSNRYAISAKSRNKAGAWEFMRYYFTDEYQDGSYYMPVNKEIWMEHARQAMERYSWTDAETGEVYYEDYTAWIGGESIVIDPLSQEEVDALYDFVCSLDTPYYYDEDIVNIINEEAEAFFAGQKSVEQVAEIIQGRAQIYVDEGR
ncbi:MAG: extracellular solute-binding protein [Lachnospiraceae bacterium]|nr:extracellular solute-binding protein [Lachnospiraceae bacterium]